MTISNLLEFGQWNSRSYDLSQYISLTNTMQISIETADWDAFGGHLVEGGYQINLFEDNEKHIHLIQAIDKMRERYGDRAIVIAAGMEAKSISRWNPFNGEPPPLLANRRQ